MFQQEQIRSEEGRPLIAVGKGVIPDELSAHDRRELEQIVLLAVVLLVDGRIDRGFQHAFVVDGAPLRTLDIAIEDLDLVGSKEAEVYAGPSRGHWG